MGLSYIALTILRTCFDSTEMVVKRRVSDSRPAAESEMKGVDLGPPFERQ